MFYVAVELVDLMNDRIRGIVDPCILLNMMLALLLLLEQCYTRIHNGTVTLKGGRVLTLKRTLVGIIRSMEGPAIEPRIPN